MIASYINFVMPEVVISTKKYLYDREELNNRAYVHTYTFGRIVIDK